MQLSLHDYDQRRNPDPRHDDAANGTSHVKLLHTCRVWAPHSLVTHSGRKERRRLRDKHAAAFRYHSNSPRNLTRY